MKVWVLTHEINEYDQHGEYFDRVWQSKPTAQQLIDADVREWEVEHVLSGGGRVDNEYMWFHLKEVEI